MHLNRNILIRTYYDSIASFPVLVYMRHKFISSDFRTYLLPTSPQARKEKKSKDSRQILDEMFLRDTTDNFSSFAIGPSFRLCAHLEAAFNYKVCHRRSLKASPHDRRASDFFLSRSNIILWEISRRLR